MTQVELNAAVAAATGETRRTVDELGFSLADPLCPHYDPEPSPVEKFLDWDDVQTHRWERVAVC